MNRKRIVALLLTVTLLMGSLCGCRPAVNLEEDFALWLSPAGSFLTNSRPASAVKWQYNAVYGAHYIYLPTEGDLTKMQFWLSGAEECEIAGVPVKNGHISNITPLVEAEEPIEVTVGKDLYTLVIMKSANIGSMYLTTQSGTLDYLHLDVSNEEIGTMRFVNADGKKLYDGALTQISGRGNATWGRPKKSYQIKLTKDVDLVGQGAGPAKTWVLLANYGERSLIRNTIAYNLAYDAGMSDATLSCFVDLYCNGEYLGNYQLCEKVQIAGSRIEVNDLEKTTQAVNEDKLKEYLPFGEYDNYPLSKKGYEIPNNPKDITGGYLLEIEMEERYLPESSGFVTSRGRYVVIKEPERASKEQVEYIANYFQEYEDAVFAEDGINPTTGKAFYEYFDLTSLAKKYIIEELVKNFDADKTSQFYYKPSDSESEVGFCGPVWDYDNAFDNFKAAARKDGLYAAYNQKYLYYELSKHQVFQDAVSKAWKENYLPYIEMCVGDAEEIEGSMLKPLSYYYELLTPSAAMNFTLWDILEQPIFSSQVDTGKTYEEHIDFLDNYITNRAAYLSSEWLD